MTPEQNVVLWGRSVLGSAFVWGETDCALIALAGIDVFTGSAHADRYRGRWTTADEALAHFAIETPSQVLKSIGAVEIAENYAVLGDVVTVPAPPWPEQLHFILGRFCLCSDELAGVSLLRAKAVTSLPGARIWRVPPCPKPSP